MPDTPIARSAGKYDVAPLGATIADPALERRAHHLPFERK